MQNIELMFYIIKEPAPFVNLYETIGCTKKLLEKRAKREPTC